MAAGCDISISRVIFDLEGCWLLYSCSSWFCVCVRACVCVCVCVCVCFAHILLKISGSTRDRRGERSEVAPDVVLPARPSGRFWWRPGNVARAAAVATAAANEAAAVAAAAAAAAAAVV